MTALRILCFCLLTITANCTKATEMKTISEVKRAHEAALLALPDVASVGVGRDGKGGEAIVVSLARDNAEAKARLPGRLDGYPVIVKITGAIRSQ